MNETYNTIIEPLAPLNQHFSSIKANKQTKTKISGNTFNMSRTIRSATPHNNEDLSLSPVPV